MNGDRDVGATPAPDTELRVLRTGDRWEYELSGHVERDGERLAVRGHSTVTVETRDSARGPRPAIVFARELRLVGVDGAAGDLSPPTGLFYFEQDAGALDVRIVGDNMGPGGADRFAAEPQVFYPGRWSTATRYANALDFGADGTVANTLVVDGVEAIETPLGRFAAWRAPITSASAQFGTVEGRDYWTPGLGAPIRFEMSVAGPDGALMTTVALMRVARLVDG